MVEGRTNSGDGFYADGEDVGSEVARVGKGVFFPKLRKESVHAGDFFTVVDVVSWYYRGIREYSELRCTRGEE